MIRPRPLTARLAGPMARRPGLIAALATLFCLLGAIGFARWSVDPGADLLVGRTSPAQRVADRFSAQFGTDPIVLVLAARQPASFYVEQDNLLKLVALESDIARNTSVASVLGPGTVVEAAQRAAQTEIQKTVQQYNQYVYDRALLAEVSQAGGDPSKIDPATLQSFESRAKQAATLALAELVSDLVKAAGAADSARTAFNSSAAAKAPDARIVDAGERAAQAAAAAVPVPPTFAQYLAGGGPNAGGQASSDAAHQAFVTIAAAYGDCYQATAQALGHPPSCQSFLARLLLDLPSCPTATAFAATPAGAVQPFCPPKSQWAAVLPPPRPGQPSYAVITVRLTGAAAADPGAVDRVRSCIQTDLESRDHNQSCSSAPVPKTRQQTVASIGRLLLTECGASPDVQRSPAGACPYLDYTLAGAPLLARGVAGSITRQLEVLVPVALLVMLLLLLGARRLRGRRWPLPAAVAAALLTFGLTLLSGTPLTPAVLAGVPVLVGLGVDYAVQLLSRFGEERGRGLEVEPALAATLATSGRATLVAALSMIGGLGVLAVIAGVDIGPLVAVPLVAEFAVVVLVGVAAAWLAAVLIALPAAAMSERRRPAAPRPEPAAAPAATRTLALAARWPAVLLPAAALALVGWVALASTPVQTDAERLLAPSLQQLRDLRTVRAQTGYANEVDLLLEGQVTTQAALLYQREASSDLRCRYGDGVAQVTSIADVILANGATSLQTSGANPCVPASPAPSPSPSPSPAASPSAAASPTASPVGAVPPDDVVRVAGTPAATPAPAPAPAPAAGTQSAVICELRLLAPVSRSLVGGIPLDTPPCPPVDPITFTPLTADTTATGAPAAIDPRSARIVMATRITTFSDLAKLVDQVRADVARTRPSVLTTAEPTGLTALAVQAYDTLTSRVLLLNIVPIAGVALLLLALLRSPRRALVPVLPTALAAGWAPLVVRGLGHLPGDAGATLGSLNPLTVVLGALVVALGTEFGVVLLERFHEERWRGLEPGDAAAVALRGVGRAIGLSALTLGAGFAVLAVSGPFPGGIPLIADFGLAVVLELALAVVAVVAVMLPVALALEMRSPLPAPASPPVTEEPPPPPPAPGPVSGPCVEEDTEESAEAEPEPPGTPDEPSPGAPPGPRLPGVSGRGRHRPAPEPPPEG